MTPKCFTKSTKYPDNAHLNKYRKVGVYPDGEDGHRVTYEGACFICGAPITVHKLWRCAPGNIPDIIKDRILCGEHG
jgi:hypothetical protein